VRGVRGHPASDSSQTSAGHIFLFDLNLALLSGTLEG
jgi:hypothetical protein